MTMVIIAASLLVTLVLATDELSIDQVGGIFVGLDDEPWRYVTTPFVHDSLGYQFVALTAVGIFGSLLERRFGWLPCCSCSSRPARRGGPPWPSPAAALRRLPDLRRARRQRRGARAAHRLVRGRSPRGRRGDDRENDLLGVYVFAAVLLLLPLAVEARPAWWRASRARPSAPCSGLALPLFTKR